jgi:pyrroloquinoline quinone biosynthesis protein D
VTFSATRRPKIARKARLRWDEKDQKYFLLFPERGLQLSASSAEIVKLCTGEHTASEVARKLLEKFPQAPAATVENDVMNFLTELDRKGLLEPEPVPGPEGA